MINQTDGLRAGATDLPQAPAWVRFSAAVIRRLPAGRYRAMDILPRPSSAFVMHMAEEAGGYPFHCDLRDTISREVCFTGCYEPQESALVRSILRPGMSFVDVGANWGYFTLLAASLVETNGRVLSLEPDPRLFSILKENVTRGCLDQVTPLQVAAAHETGILSLAGYTEAGGNFGISRITVSSDEQEGVFQVQSDSLDHLLELHGMLSVDLMKMDIEGGEVFAIPGLDKSLTSRKIKRLLLELHPIQLAEHGSTVSAITDKLQSAGYKGWTIDHSQNATRETAYKKQIKPNHLLRPFDSASQYDAWPHQLWLAPGVE
jgi:FkbM family methyltransferase